MSIVDLIQSSSTLRTHPSGQSSPSKASSTEKDASPAADVDDLTPAHWPPGQISVDALRLLELTERISTVFKASGAEETERKDPLTNIFQTFVTLQGLPMTSQFSVVNEMVSHKLLKISLFIENRISFLFHGRRHSRNPRINPLALPIRLRPSLAQAPSARPTVRPNTRHTSGAYSSTPRATWPSSSTAVGIFHLVVIISFSRFMAVPTIASLLSSLSSYVETQTLRLPLCASFVQPRPPNLIARGSKASSQLHLSTKQRPLRLRPPRVTTLHCMVTAPVRYGLWSSTTQQAVASDTADHLTLSRFFPDPSSIETAVGLPAATLDALSRVTYKAVATLPRFESEPTWLAPPLLRSSSLVEVDVVPSRTERN